jgi:DNA-binding LacI/PurR family transcriptional regulator
MAPPLAGKRSTWQKVAQSENFLQKPAKLRTGEGRMGKRGKPNRRVRLEDIAGICGVSISTASRAISGAKGVDAPQRARILETAKMLNYAMPANLAGRTVILAASSVAMVDYVRNQFTYHVLEGLNERAGMLSIRINTRAVASAADEIELLEQAQSDPAVIGCLFLTLDDEKMLTLAGGFSKPIVLVNGDDPAMRWSSVTPCNRSAAQVATEHLLRCGHRRILFLTRRGRRTIERRFEGWRDALREAGVVSEASLVVEVADWLPELAADAIAARIAANGCDFTAILAAGDSLAAGAMMGIERAGYKVPRDISVVGIDDLPQSAFLAPPLTTMHIPMREIGAIALSLLIEGIEYPALPPRRVELACRLVERGSVTSVEPLGGC